MNRWRLGDSAQRRARNAFRVAPAVVVAVAVMALGFVLAPPARAGARGDLEVTLSGPAQGWWATT
jgi:hypothetical protein